MSTPLRVALALAAALSTTTIRHCVQTNPGFDVLITNGRIVDGTGAPWFRGDVGIVGDRITAIGRLAARAAADDGSTPKAWSSRRGSSTCSASRSSTCSSTAAPRARCMQGVTTEVTGEGSSIAPVNDRHDCTRRAAEREALRRRAGLAHARRLLHAARAAVAHRRSTSATFVGAGGIRNYVDRQGRSAGDAGGARAMKQLVAQAMRAGRARPQHVAAVRARSVRVDRRDRRAREGRRALRRRLLHAPAIGERAHLRVARRGVRDRRAREHSRGDLAPEDRLQGELRQDAGGAAAHRSGAGARPRRHGEPVSLHARVERARRVPAAVGARGRPRQDARAADAIRRRASGSRKTWTTRTPRRGRTSGTAPTAATASCCRRC